MMNSLMRRGFGHSGLWNDACRVSKLLFFAWPCMMHGSAIAGPR